MLYVAMWFSAWLATCHHNVATLAVCVVIANNLSNLFLQLQVNQCRGNVKFIEYSNSTVSNTIWRKYLTAQNFDEWSNL